MSSWLTMVYLCRHARSLLVIHISLRIAETLRNLMSSTSQNNWNIIYCPNNIVKTCNLLLAVTISHYTMHTSLLSTDFCNLLNLYWYFTITGDWLENLRVISVSRLELYFSVSIIKLTNVLYKYRVNKVYCIIVLYTVLATVRIWIAWGSQGCKATFGFAYLE